jgi:adenylate cyclase
MSQEAPGRLSRLLQRIDSDPRLVELLRLGRSRLPGDERYGDPLSLTGDQAPAVLGRRLSALTAEQPGALREVGMSALQVWQGLSEAQGRGRGDRELAIVFTDLAGFSTWALDAGDTQAVALLREVGSAIEPEICSRGGEIVKRLGDGLMAVFEDAGRAIEAAHASARALEGVHVDGHCPPLRFSAKGAPKALKVYAAEPS